MQVVISAVTKGLLTPIKALKRRYVPLLMIYFAYGAQAITGVALTFWEKDFLTLSAEEILAVSVWVWLPFSIKMVFGQLVDVVPLFGSRRRSWVFLGATFMALGYLMLYGMSVQSPYLDWMGGQFNMYLGAQLIMVLGFVIQDVTADAMTVEVVDRNQADDVVKAELAIVQVLGRLSLMIASAVAGGLGGYLAGSLGYETVFLLALIVPLISVLGAILVKLDGEGGSLSEEPSKTKLNPIIFGGGIAFAVFSVLMGFSQSGVAQEVTFVVSFVLICWMLSTMLKGQEAHMVKSIVLTFTALFIFRATPSVGPGYNWWAIDVLGFDQNFFGVLRTYGGFAALIILWFASDFIAKKPIRAVLILLIFLGFLFSLPDVALFHGLHESLGINPRTIALLDTVAESPLVHLSMIPMLALIAYYAPDGQRATWFAVSASLMNLATTAGSLLTKYLNKMFIVSREIKDQSGLVVTQADYSELGVLLWTAILISLVAPLLIVLFLLKAPERSHQANS